MLLSTIGFPSGKIVSYKIVNKTGTILQDWTISGVTEIAIDVNFSIYQVDSGLIVSGFEGHALWKTAEGLIAAETINTMMSYIDASIAAVSGGVNVLQIDGDASSATNLKNQYNGTGFINSNAPATQGDVADIPTNPLLTNDSRLNNIDTPISSRSTQTSVDSIPTTPLLTNDSRLNNIDTPISSRLPVSGYTAPDNTTIGTINTNLNTAAAKIVDIFDETFGYWEVNLGTNQLILKRPNNTTLKTFDLTTTIQSIPKYYKRTPV